MPQSKDDRMTYLDRAERILQGIRDEHRYRELPERQLTHVIDFSSNDYLGMAKDPQVVEALRHATRAGSGGARLLGGRNREDSLLEEELAGWLGRERALLFSSGYLAGAGAIPVLAELVKTILSDRSNHACLIDGIRLARAPYEIYEHATLPPMNAQNDALVVSETLFSMGGDAIDPAALLENLSAGGVLLLDEAHALGIVGPEGAGLARALDDPRVIILGTLSKALGTLGGFVAGPAAVIDLLVNRARTFIFDTALPPPLVLAARIALHLTRGADDRRASLRANVARLREALVAFNLIALRPSTAAQDDMAAGETPIVPIILGDEERALRVSEALLKRRIFVPAIRPPTVPPGESRLRVSVRSDHTLEQMDLLAAELKRCIATS
jgi:8-amino-7-oxononanoate synthase